MPIEDTDIPIIDNQTDFKIDNQVERVYLYRIISATNPNFKVGLRFYKFPQKWEGLDTFISEDGAYYISAYRITTNSGYWVMAPTIGQGGSAANRVNTTFSLSFFPYGTSIEATYSSGSGNVVIGKINTDIISE